MSIIDAIKGMFGGKCECETKEGVCEKGADCCKAQEASEVKPEAPIVETPSAPIVEAPKTENPFTQAPPTEAPGSASDGPKEEGQQQ